MDKNKCRILHIVANYPDGILQQPTTAAVKNLLDATEESLNNFVVSIARTSNPFKEFCIKSYNCISISYFGLPGTFFQGLFLRRLAKVIAFELQTIGVDYDIVHGHKLTVEAVIAYYLTAKSKKHYVCTVRGFTDGDVLRWRPDRRSFYGKVLKQASLVFLPAPWTQNIIDQYIQSNDQLHQTPIHYALLPNIVHSLASEANKPTIHLNRFLTVFRAGQGKGKGFRELLLALAEARLKKKEILLDVIGCGPESDEAKWAKDLNLNNQVQFLGRLDNNETVERFIKYQGFILPTHSDTFGMVYVEALMAGVPVLYSGGTGIDGYLNDFDVGIKVDPFDQESINKGVINFAEKASKLRDNLNICLKNGKLEFFTKDSIATSYCHKIIDLFELGQ